MAPEKMMTGQLTRQSHDQACYIRFFKSKQARTHARTQKSPHNQPINQPNQPTSGAIEQLCMQRWLQHWVPNGHRREPRTSRRRNPPSQMEYIIVTMAIVLRINECIQNHAQVRKYQLTLFNNDNNNTYYFITKNMEQQRQRHAHPTPAASWFEPNKIIKSYYAFVCISTKLGILRCGGGCCWW